MHKYFKILTIITLFIGFILFVSGNEAYFHKSGGTGLIILMFGTPLFAILTYLTRDKKGSKKKATAQKSATLLKVGIALLIGGIISFLLGYFIPDIYDTLGAAMFGSLMIIAGLIVLVISAVKR